MEPLLLSPEEETSALDEPKVDFLEKLEDPEDLKGSSPKRLMKCCNHIVGEEMFLASVCLLQLLDIYF